MQEHALSNSAEPPIGQDVIADAGLAVARSHRHGPSTARPARVQRYLSLLDRAAASAEMNDLPDEPVCAIHQSHPGVLETPAFYRDAADMAEQIVATLGPCEGVVAFGQRRIEVGQCVGALLGRKARPPFPRLRDRPPDHRPEARQVGFQHIVGGAASQRLNSGFLADGTGHEDERGVGSALTGKLQRAHPTETGQREIRHDDVGFQFGNPREKIRLGLHSARLETQARAAQFTHLQFGIGFDILDEQNFECTVHCGGLYASRFRFVTSTSAAGDVVHRETGKVPATQTSDLYNHYRHRAGETPASARCRIASAQHEGNTRKRTHFNDTTETIKSSGDAVFTAWLVNSTGSDGHESVRGA